MSLTELPNIKVATRVVSDWKAVAIMSIIRRTCSAWPLGCSTGAASLVSGTRGFQAPCLESAARSTRSSSDRITERYSSIRTTHLLRAEADAILVGSGTVLADDPELTCRLPGLGARSPDRIVLDTRLRTPASAKVYRQNSTKERVLPGASVAHKQPRVWIAAAIGEAERCASAHWQGGALVFDVGSRDGRALDLDGLLDTLAVNGITRLMVEGGPTVWHAFLVAGFVDEVCVVTAPTRANGATIAVIEGDHDAFFARFNLHPALSRGLGADRLAIYRRESP